MMKYYLSQGRFKRMVILCSVFTLLRVVCYAEEEAQTLPMRDTPTEEEIMLVLKQRKQQPPEKAASVLTLRSSTPVESTEGLMSSSEILCFGDAMTLVPKGAILQTPRNLAGRLKRQADVQLVTWSEFYPANRSWIVTMEVSSDQAEGKSTLPEEIKSLVTSGVKIVVATYKGNPISVIPFKAPITPTTTTATPQP